MQEEKRFAVLIDADNVSAKYIKFILDEKSNYGVATYKRIYGDWTKPTAASWKDVLLENSVTPVQQYGYTVGKNATDSAMIIDAMDILYSGNVEGYCIVSSDSDFTKLASRLRESGMLVVGMGEKKTPKPFIAACNQFKYLDILAETEKKSMEMEANHLKANAAKEKNVKNQAFKGKDIESEAGNKVKTFTTAENTDGGKDMTDINVIKTTILKMMNDVDEGDQRMNMGELGSRLVKRYPDFDVRNYGDTKLSKFLKKFDFLQIETSGKGGSGMWISLKANADILPAIEEKPLEEKVVEEKPKEEAPVKRRRTYRKRTPLNSNE
ncbi:MAG: NYN domain-containing protein [Mobilitalea sp.]